MKIFIVGYDKTEAIKCSQGGQVNYTLDFHPGNLCWTPARANSLQLIANS